MEENRSFYRDKLIKAAGLPQANKIAIETMEEAKKLDEQGIEVVVNPEGEASYGYYLEEITYSDQELEWARKAKMLRNSNLMMYCVVLIAAVMLLSAVVSIWSGVQIGQLMGGIFR